MPALDTQIAFNLSTDMLKALRRIAEEEERSVSAVARRLIAAQLKQRENGRANP